MTHFETVHDTQILFTSQHDDVLSLHYCHGLVRKSTNALPASRRPQNENNT